MAKKKKKKVIVKPKTKIEQQIDLSEETVKLLKEILKELKRKP